MLVLPPTLSGINEASNLPSAPVAGITGSGPDVAVKEEFLQLNNTFQKQKH